jgi:hypothetical protein
METTGYDRKPYESALFGEDLDVDMEPWIRPCDLTPAPPPDALAYLRAMEDAAHAGRPFEHYSDDQVARMEELAERQLGLRPDYCTGADD